VTDQTNARVRERSHDGDIPCMAAHTAAWETNTPPAEVGKIIDDLGLYIVHCQLGLFGYGPKAEGKSKLIRPMAAIDPQITARIEQRAIDERITCLDVWEIAHELNMERLLVGNTADAMGMKIAPCQLGAF